MDVLFGQIENHLIYPFFYKVYGRRFSWKKCGKGCHLMVKCFLTDRYYDKIYSYLDIVRRRGYNPRQQQ